MTPTFSAFLKWLLVQKDLSYNFDSPTDCIVARFTQDHDRRNEKDPYRFEDGNWSSLFPGAITILD